MQTCSVCGEAYPATDGHRLDMCHDCWRANFAGNPLEGPITREALDAYIDSAHQAHQLTPFQVQAIARMHAYWQRTQAPEDTA